MIAPGAAPDSISLAGGKAGNALFLLYYYKLTEEEVWLDHALSVIEDVLTVMTDADWLPTFSSGAAGIGWLLEHAVKENFFETDTDELTANIDKLLADWMMDEIALGNYDYLHGATGIAMYLLQKADRPFYQELLADYIIALRERSITEKDTLKWPFYSFLPEAYGLQQNEFNLGLSHGIPAIIVFLTKAYQAGILPDLCREMIRKSSHYVLCQQHAPAADGSHFGNIVSETEPGTGSRLAWCYGDLGICAALWRAATVLQDTSMQAAVLDVARANTLRRDLPVNLVTEPWFCHGTAGIAYIFHKFHRWTGEAVFHETAGFWYSKTLAMMPTGVTEWGLLNGTAGTGLALISAVADFEPAWDEALLLS